MCRIAGWRIHSCLSKARHFPVTTDDGGVPALSPYHVPFLCTWSSVAECCGVRRHAPGWRVGRTSGYPLPLAFIILTWLAMAVNGTP